MISNKIKTSAKIAISLAGFICVGIIFLVMPSSIEAANRYWVGSNGGNTNDTANWASADPASCTGGGASVPGTGDVAIFDPDCDNNATVNAAFDVLGINVQSGYAGTITQSGATAITTRASGFTFASASATFTGGSGAININLGGDFALSDGTFTSTSGTMTINDNFTVSGGTFTHNSGTVLIGMAADDASSLTGTVTFYNLTIDNGCNGGTATIASGTLTVNNTFTANRNSGLCVSLDLDGPGTLEAKGNITLTGVAFAGSNVDGKGGGTAVVTINGTGDQNFTGTTAANGSEPGFPSVVINKSSGTLFFVNKIVFQNDFTYTAGTIDTSTNTSTLNFDPEQDLAGTITGSINFYNFGAVSYECIDSTITVASGTILTVTNTTTFQDTTSSCGTPNLNAPGSLIAQGAVTSTTSGYSGTIPVTFAGTNSQTFTPSGTLFPSGTITINKPSGTVTLAAALTTELTAGQDIVIASGVFNLATFALTVPDQLTINGGLVQTTANIVMTAGTITVGSTGYFINNSTGDISFIGGQGITNNGYVRLDGTSAGCGGANGISLTRASGATRVNLNGAGNGKYRIYDITLGTNSAFAASPGITVWSSSVGTGNTSNGITDGGVNTCPAENTWVSSSSNSWNTAANWTGIGAGAAVPTTGDTAIFDATSVVDNSIDTSPSIGGIEVRQGYTGTVTQASTNTITLDSGGYTQAGLGSTFTGGSGAITINTGGDFALYAGTFTSTSGTLTEKDDWTVSGGTFTHNSGTVLFDASADASATITGNISFSALTFQHNSASARTIAIASDTTLTVNGTLLFAHSSSGTDTFTGTGTITALGNVTTTGAGWYGTTVVTIAGTGNQTLTGESDTATYLPAITINKVSGTLAFSSTITVTDNWLYQAGTIDTSAGVVAFDAVADGTGTISGTHSLPAVTFMKTVRATELIPFLVVPY